MKPSAEGRGVSYLFSLLSKIRLRRGRERTPIIIPLSLEGGEVRGGGEQIVMLPPPLTPPTRGGELKRCCMDIKAAVDKLEQELIELRRDFHRHPELGLEEHRTADKIESYLKPLGLEISRIGETGVVGLLKGDQPGRTLMLRADIDALPVQEMTSVPYKSVHEGMMHACGHDGHMAMLLLAARILCDHKKRIKGNIKFLFQPNEENMHAGFLIQKGVLENPTVDAAFGIHLMTPLETGKIGVCLLYTSDAADEYQRV